MMKASILIEIKPRTRFMMTAFLSILPTLRTGIPLKEIIIVYQTLASIMPLMMAFKYKNLSSL